MACGVGRRGLGGVCAFVVTSITLVATSKEYLLKGIGDHSWLKGRGENAAFEACCYRISARIITFLCLTAALDMNLTY